MNKSLLPAVNRRDEDNGMDSEKYIVKSEELKNYLKISQQERQDWKNKYNNLKQRKENLKIESKCELCSEFDFRSHLSEDMQRLLSECEHKEERSIEEVKRFLDQIDNICLINLHYEQQRKQLGILQKSIQDRIYDYQRAAIMKTLVNDFDFDMEKFSQSSSDCCETTFLCK